MLGSYGVLCEWTFAKSIETLLFMKNKKLKSLNDQCLRLYADFLSERLVFANQLPYHKINENNSSIRKAASYTLNTIAINVMYID